MKEATCLICGSAEHEHLATFDNDPYLRRLSNRTDYSVTYVVCRRCGFVFTNPMLDGAELDEMYSEKYRPAAPDEKFIKNNLEFMGERYKWIIKKIGENTGSKRILDIGCSAGTLLKTFKDNSWDAHGIEPSETFARYGSTQFGLPVKTGFYSKDSYPGEEFDIVACLQVLEHVPDPETMLSAMRGNLSSDGYLVIGVPTLFRPLRPIHPQTLASPHLYIFSSNTLRLLLQRTGFDIVAIDHSFKGLIALARKAKPSGIDFSEGDTCAELIAAYKAFTDPASQYNRNMDLLKANNQDLVPLCEKTPLSSGDICAVHESPEGDTEKEYWNLLIRRGARTFPLFRENPHLAACRAADKVVSESAAGKFGKDGIIIMFGLEMGHLPLEVVKRLHKGNVLLICERDENIFQRAMLYNDLGPLLSDKRVKILVGEHMPFDEYISRFSKNYLLTGKINLIKNMPSYNLYPDFYKALAERIPDRLKVIKVNRSTIVGLGLKMMENTLDDMHLTMQMPGVANLRNLFRDVPAVIVSAGPSLEKNFHLLQEVKGKGVVIGADTVLRLLVPNGIVPDFTITADPQETTYRKFKGIPMDPASFLVCHPINYPDIIRTFAGRRFVMGSNNTICRWLSEYYKDKGQIDYRSQSVAHMAFNLAMLIGANPIIFIGQDLCYYDAKKKHAGNLSKGSPWEGKENKSFIEDKDIFGNEVKTTTLFQSFGVLLNEGVKSSKRLCINATEGGLGIEGTVVMPFSDAIRKYCSGEPVDVYNRIISVYKTDEIKDVQGLLRKLDAAAEELKEINNNSRKILKNVEKVKRVIEKGEAGSKRYIELSDALQKGTEKMKGKEHILNLFTEYAYDLELYMSKQDIQEIDTIEDLNNRFEKQVARALVYYNGLLKVGVPFEKGLRTLSARVKKLEELKELFLPLKNDTRSDTLSKGGAQLLLKLAKDYKELFLFEQAEELFKKVLEQDPKNRDALFHLGEIFYTVHHPREALHFLRQADADKATHKKLKKLISACNRKMEFWDQKIADARIEKCERSLPEQLVYEGEFYYHLGQRKLAEAKWKEAIDLDPLSLTPYLDLVKLYEEDQEWDTCIEIFEQALNSLGENPVLYRELALFSGKCGEVERAFEFFEAATALDEGMLVGAGDFFVTLGIFNKALLFYEKAASSGIDHPELTSKMAFCYAKHVSEQMAGNP